MEKIKTEIVAFDVAVPAKKLDIIAWLISGGRFGKLFVREKLEVKKFFPPKSFNCRCSHLSVEGKNIQETKNDQTN